MRQTTTVILMLLLYTFCTGQTRRMNHVPTGQTFTFENKTQTVQPLLQKADREFRSLDYEGAFFALESAVAQEPNSAEALIMRARFRKMVGMGQEAQQDMKLANALNPYAADLYGYNGSSGLLNILAIAPEESIRKLGDTKKLNYYYEALDRQIIANEVDDKEIDYIEAALQHLHNNDLDEALVTVDAMRQKFPQSALAADLKGIILQRQDNLDAAAFAFSEAVQLNPDFAIAWYNLGQIERLRQNYEPAKRHLNKAIELQSDLTKAYFERAILNAQMDNQADILDDYNTIIELRGNTYIEAYLNRGLTKKMLGDFIGALTDLDQAIEEFPNKADLRKNRGNLYLLFGMPQKAIDDYTKAIQLDDDYAEAYYNRAIAFLIIYDKVSACADLDKSVELGYKMAEEIRTYGCSVW